MTSDIKRLEEEVGKLRREIQVVKHAISEDFELSEEAVAALRKARATPESEYVDL